MGNVGSKPGGGSSSGSGPFTKPSGGGSGGDPYSSGTTPYEGGGSFWDFNPRAIAGLNPFQRAAGEGAAGMGEAGRGDLRSARGFLDTLGNRTSPNARRAQGYISRLGSGGSGYLDRGVNLANRYSSGNLPGQFKESGDLSRSLVDLGRKKVTGENVATDPAFMAAQKAFSQSQMPLIQNQAALAGLGRSSAMTNAIAHGNAQTMVPFIQDSLAREERGIGREISTTGKAAGDLFNIGGTVLGENARGAGALFQGAGQEAGNLAQAASGSAGLAGQESQDLLNTIQGFMGLGGQEYSQNANTINTRQNLGNQYRGVEQEGLDAPYQEQQRLWAEALNSMYGPLGFLGNMGGAETSSSKK